MADAPKLSFIPKQVNGPAPVRGRSRRRHFNVVGFVGMVVFLCGMILSVGVYLYKDWSQEVLAGKQAELAEVKSSFSRDDVARLRSLDRRITLAKSLLDRHLSPSVVFDALEEKTQEEAQLTAFSYARRESGFVELTLSGVTRRFNTLVLQSKGLADVSALASVLFSDISVDEEGVVGFSATAEGNLAALAYTAPSVPVATTTATTTTPSVPPVASGQSATTTATSTAP